MWLERRLETDRKDNRENGALQCDADLFRDRLTPTRRVVRSTPLPTFLADKFCGLQGMQPAKSHEQARKSHRFNDLNVWRESR